VMSASGRMVWVVPGLSKWSDACIPEEEPYDGMIEDIKAVHGTTRGWTIGMCAKLGGTLSVGTWIDSGGKPSGTTDVGRSTGMGDVSVATNVPISKMSKSLVRWGEAKK
jgi:hypothetical protein